MIKILFTSIFLFSNIFLFSQKIWFTNASYDCSYALNCSNSVVVDTITFKFKVNYDNINAINKDRGSVTLYYGYFARLYYIEDDVHFLVWVNDNGSIKIITNDKCQIFFDKNYFIYKIDVFDRNFPDIHSADIGKSYSNPKNHLKYHDQKRTYFGKIDEIIHDNRFKNDYYNDK